MKHLFLGLTAFSLIVLTACNGNSETKQENTAQTANTAVEKGNGNGNFSELFGHYQHLTFALSSDNDKEAANAAKGMLTALPKVNTEKMSAGERDNYEEIAADIKEHAEHISENVGNIAHQREHLVLLSKDFYDIAKAFGTEKPLYKVYCSMYDNDKGAYWLSDNKDVKNPYYGADMLTCGEVQEELN